MQHFLSNVPALHEVVVLITIRHVPLSTVLPEERLLIKPLPDFPGCASPWGGCELGAFWNCVRGCAAECVGG